MSFAAPAEDYDRWMGRYSAPLASELADAAGIDGDMRVLDVRQGVAEELPWEDGSFDAALACLVIAFMKDPEAGVAEMVRVTRPGGTVAACMWDVPNGRMEMLRLYWQAVRAVDPGSRGEAHLAGATEGDIAARLSRAGLEGVEAGELTVGRAYSGFDELWEGYTLGIGPAGQHLRALSDDDRPRVRGACGASVPDGPFELAATAWFARGTVPG